MGRPWNTVGLQPGMFSLTPVLAGEHPRRVPSCRGHRPCWQPPAHRSGAATPLSPGTPCLHTCRSRDRLERELMGGVGPASGCCHHGGGEGGDLLGDACPRGYQGPLDLPSATVPRAAGMLQELFGR